MKKPPPRRTDIKLLELIAERMKEQWKERGYTKEFVVERTGLKLPGHEAKSAFPSLVSISFFVRV